MGVAVPPLICRSGNRATPAQPVASHPPQKKNSDYGEKTPRDVPNQHQHNTAEEHDDTDQAALPGFCMHEGLSDELAAAVVHWGSFQRHVSQRRSHTTM
jgi:hypothetical protein